MSKILTLFIASFFLFSAIAQDITLSDVLYPQTKIEVSAYAKRLTEYSDKVIAEKRLSGVAKDRVLQAKEFAFKKVIFEMNSYKEKRKAYLQAIAASGLLSANTSYKTVVDENTKLSSDFLLLSEGATLVATGPTPTPTQTPAPTPTAAPAPIDPTDKTAPSITAVTVASMTSTGATITWTTNEPSESKILYGATTAYGQTTPYDATLRTSHSVTIPGLTLGGIYHYRVTSKDASGNYGTASDAILAIYDEVAPSVGTSLTDTWENKFTLPNQDANGWSILTPSADSQIVYVSTSGNDSTAKSYFKSSPEVGGNPYNPSGAILPFATIDAAFAKVRAGYPDYVLLKRGETWTRTAPIKLLAGRSINERMVLSYYGTNPTRPLVKFYGVNLSNANNSAVVGIHFSASQRNPHSPDFTGFNTTADGFNALGGYGGSITGGILIEDCWFDFFTNNIIQSPRYGAPVLTDIIVRRNIISNNYSSGGHSQGFYTDKASVLLEENVFDHNGWYQQGINNEKTDGKATMFNHNTYMSSTRDSIFRNNIFLRGSSIHNKFTSNTSSGINKVKAWNLLLDNNLYVEGEVAISLGGNDNQKNGPRWKNIHITNNSFMHIGRTQPTSRTLGWGIDVQDWEGGLVRGNIFTHIGDATVSNTYTLHSSGYTSGVDYSNNIFYKIDGGNPQIYFSKPATQTAVKFHHNEVQGKRLLRNELTESGIFYQNYYHSSLLQTKWFSKTIFSNGYYVPGDISLAEYQNQTGDTTSRFETRSYVDPDRTIETYLTTLGYTNTDMNSFFAELAKQSKFYWRPQLTADAINKYIRTGFCLAGNPNCR